MTDWKCENCTLDNPVNALICEVCGQKRQSLPVSNGNNINNNDSNDENEWQCGKCTFSNRSSSIKCEMCDTINPKNKNNSIVDHCWEWKGGNTWHEYPQDISDKIESAYYRGQLHFDLNLSHAHYVIDLTKLKQINKSSNKSRKIQRVKYEYDAKNDNDYNNDNNDGNKMDIDDKMDIDHDEKEEKGIIDKVWKCSFCTLENDDKYDICEVCQNKRTSAMDSSAMDSSPMDTSPMKKKTKNVIKNNQNTKNKNAKNKNVEKKSEDNDKNGGTLLAMFEKEKNKNIPKPLPTLKKKKKRKLSEIMDQDEININEPKKQKVKIAKKYSDKHKGDLSIGAALNKDLIDKLWELSIIERNSGNRFKANAYSKACKALRTCGKKIISGKEAQELNGVGKKIAAKIDEILSTGHLVKLDKLRADDTIQAINELCQIHGIGPKKAAELVKQHKIFNIESLRQRQDLLNHQQKLGLKYFKHINKRIPRKQVEEIGEIVRNELNKIDKKIIMNICGSYRRGKSDCGDVDILLTHCDKKYNDKKYSKQLLNNIIIKLRECKLLVEDLAHGPVKYMGICRYQKQEQEKEKQQDIMIPKDFTFSIPNDINEDGDIILMGANNNNNNDNNNNNNDDDHDNKVYFRRIDLKFINYSFYYANLLYFTGSDRFNVEMRIKANEKQLILNENGVYKMLDEDDHSKKSKDPVIEPKCEKDIFDVIGMDYVKPTERSW